MTPADQLLLNHILNAFNRNAVDSMGNHRHLRDDILHDDVNLWVDSVQTMRPRTTMTLSIKCVLDRHRDTTSVEGDDTTITSNDPYVTGVRHHGRSD